MIASYPDRRFQLWEYRVSHGSLLVRSPKSADSAHNVDVVFVGVDYLAVPRVLEGVTIERGLEDDRELLNGTVGEVDPDRLFVLISAGRRHYVVAVACRVSESDTDIFDSPF